jgi:hypothetical protein
VPPHRDVGGTVLFDSISVSAVEATKFSVVLIGLITVASIIIYSVAVASINV